LSVQESWSELSDSDVAKFPALFGVRQIIKSDPVEARSQLLEAVGYFFLSRMLRSKEAPTGCPPRFYQSVALSVLACFVDDEDIMTDACILFNIPELLVIIEKSDSEEYEDDVMLVNDAYKVMTAIVSTEVGREAFIASRGMNVLSQLNMRQRFQDEEALELLLDMLTYERDKCWDYYQGPEDLFLLLQKIYENYDSLESSDDLDLDDIVETILLTLPSDDNLKEITSKTDGGTSSSVIDLCIGNVIEVCFNNCDNKSYLSYFNYDRLETHVDTLVHDLTYIMEHCVMSETILSSTTSPQCQFQYRQYQCYPDPHIKAAVEIKI